jgi:hypothetical protein
VKRERSRDVALDRELESVDVHVLTPVFHEKYVQYSRIRNVLIWRGD